MNYYLIRSRIFWLRHKDQVAETLCNATFWATVVGVAFILYTISN